MSEAKMVKSRKSAKGAAMAVIAVIAVVSARYVLDEEDQDVSAMTPQEYAETLDAITDGGIRPGPIVTGRVGLDGVAGAFETLGDPEEHCKIMVTPHEDNSL